MRTLSELKLLHGESKTPRKLERHWGDDEPTLGDAAIPVWIRDGWNVSESKVKETAGAVGVESPVVHVLLPRVEAEGIRDALASHTAAQGTINQRPEPQTAEGRQAKQGMQSRVTDGERRLVDLFGKVVTSARVFQGGGHEITRSSLREGVEAAATSSLARLFPEFKAADNPAWAKVITKAREGAPDALGSVGWPGDVPANPVCKEVLVRVSGAGTSGADVQRRSNWCDVRMAGRRSYTVRCSPYLRTAMCARRRTACPCRGPRSFLRRRSARPCSSRRTSRPRPRSVWPYAVCSPRRASPTRADRKGRQSAASCSDSSI